MQARDKWIIAILILLVALTGLTYYGFAYNETQTTTTTDTGAQTIIVNGDGSSGTGDVQNVEVVQSGPSTGTTKTIYVEQETPEKETVVAPEKTNMVS